VAALALSFLAAGTGRVAAQAAEPMLADLATRLAAMTAVTGFEQQLVDSLIALLPGAMRDRAGNAVVVLGGGERRRLAACPVSEPGFVVGNVRNDGWLTLRRAPGRVLPAVERSIEGQRVTVLAPARCREWWACADPPDPRRRRARRHAGQRLPGYRRRVEAVAAAGVEVLSHRAREGPRHGPDLLGAGNGRPRCAARAHGAPGDRGGDGAARRA
jgi:hypothetical protein